LLSDDFISQQDGAPAHSAKLSQAWLSANCRDFIDKDSWPPNSPDLNPLDFHVQGAMLEAYNRVNPKSHNIAELKEMLKDIWEKLPIDSKCCSVLHVQKRLQACVKADGGYFEHLSH